MQNPFAGHSHGPSPYFVPDCALCDAAKEARNRAIGHLNDALRLLSGYRPDGDDRPTLRLNLGPTNVTGEDTGRCHSIDLTPKQAEALADAIDSVNAYDDQQMGDQMMAVADAQIASWDHEEYPGGDFSAAAVAQCNTDLWDQVNDLFAGFDVRQISTDVMNERRTNRMAVIEALDNTFGDDVHDPLADEDEDA